jgi:hypothetical protein
MSRRPPPCHEPVHRLRASRRWFTVTHVRPPDRRPRRADSARLCVRGGRRGRARDARLAPGRPCAHQLRAGGRAHAPRLGRGLGPAGHGLGPRAERVCSGARCRARARGVGRAGGAGHAAVAARWRAMGRRGALLAADGRRVWGHGLRDARGAAAGGLRVGGREHHGGPGAGVGRAARHERAHHGGWGRLARAGRAPGHARDRGDRRKRLLPAPRRGPRAAAPPRRRRRRGLSPPLRGPACWCPSSSA